MSQDRSVINIDFNVEEYVEDGMQFLKPPNQPPTNAMMRRKRDRRLLSPVPTRQINELVSGQINHRVKELKTFRKDSQSALQSPLLVTAIIKKTAERLERIEDHDVSHMRPYDRLQRACRIVYVLVSSCVRWRRYMVNTPAPGKGNPKGGLIGFESGAFKENSKISRELREILTSPPNSRTEEQLKKVQKLCRGYKALLLFPFERELDLARVIAYERYDSGRVISCQGRKSEWLHLVLSGRVLKERVNTLVPGVNKTKYGELTQGNTSDPAEVESGEERQYSMTCKGPVEMLVIHRQDFLELLQTSPDSTIHFNFLSSVQLFKEFPLDSFRSEPNSIVAKYFGKDTVIVKDSRETPYFYVIKRGTCKVVRQQEVLDSRHNIILPQITKRKGRTVHARHMGHDVLDHREIVPKNLNNVNANIYKRLVEKPRRKSDEHRTGGSLSSDGQVTIPTEGLITTASSQVDEMGVPGLDNHLSQFASTDHGNNHESLKGRTRVALLQLATLKSGDIFGLESMMPKVASMIHMEEGTVTRPCSVILISDGAECIAVNKKFFLSRAGTSTLVQLSALVEEYMTIEEARKQIQEKDSWDVYKHKLIKKLATSKKKKTHSFR